MAHAKTKKKSVPINRLAGVPQMAKHQKQNTKSYVVVREDKDKSYRVVASTIGSAIFLGAIGSGLGPVGTAVCSAVGAAVGFGIAKNDSEPDVK